MKDASLPHPSSTLVHIGTLVAEVNSISDSAGYDQIPGHIPALLSCSSTTTSPHPAPVPFHCLLCACVIASDSASSELQRRLALAPHHNLQFARNMELFVCTTTSPGFCTLPPPGGGGAYPYTIILTWSTIPEMNGIVTEPECNSESNSIDKVHLNDQPSTLQGSGMTLPGDCKD